jgi:hypothetical protein
MAATQDMKVTHAEIGRTGLYKAVRLSAGANWMEKNYQTALGDLKAKEAYEGMAKEVVDLEAEEKLAEILARFIIVLLMQTRPEQQPMILWQLYTHLRATGLLDAVKPNIGSIVDLSGRLIPPKEG